MGKKSRNKLKIGRTKTSAPRIPHCAFMRCTALANVNDQCSKCAGCGEFFCKMCSLSLVRGPNCEDCLAPMALCQKCFLGTPPFRNSRHEIEMELPHLREVFGKKTFSRYLKEFHGQGDETMMEERLVCENSDCWKGICAECSLSERQGDGLRPRRFIKCGRCSQTRCRSCVDASFAMDGCDGEDFVATCQECNDSFCQACVPMRHDRKTLYFKCEPCYFKAKPCTNPDCPNEAGAPTKRCGDCCRFRYCSKECQLTMWPKHSEECGNICKERDAKLGTGYLEAEEDEKKRESS